MTDRSGDPATMALAGAESPAEAQARMQQGVIDAQVEASRRCVLADFTDRLYSDPGTLVSEDFLALADRSTIHRAIVIAASGVADACDLQTRDPRTGALRIAHHRGLPPSFMDYLAVADDADDVTTGHPMLDLLLTVRFRSMHSYPLRDGRGQLLGMLSLHYRTSGSHAGQERLARAAARALAQVGMPADRPVAPASPAVLSLPAPEDQPTGTTADLTVSAGADGVITVVVRGALDAVTAADCARCLRTTVARLRPHQTLAIDLRELEFLAVAGARVLIDAAHLCAERAVDCRMLAGRDHIARTVLDRLDPRPPLRIVEEMPRVVSERP